MTQIITFELGDTEILRLQMKKQGSTSKSAQMTAVSVA
jgi:hypothetical protein